MWDVAYEKKMLRNMWYNGARYTVRKSAYDPQYRMVVILPAMDIYFLITEIYVYPQVNDGKLEYEHSE